VSRPSRGTLLLLTSVAAILCLIPAAVAHSQQPIGIVMYKGICFQVPGYTHVACPPTPVPTAPSIFPVKSLAVNGSLTSPYGVKTYSVSITSMIACFPEDEPIDVGTLGSPGEAVLSPATPGPLQSPNMYVVTPNPQGQATLSLEVWTQRVGPEGVAVQAYWPRENVLQIVPVIAATLPTVGPGTATPTATAVPGGPLPTATAVPVPLFTRVCVSPRTLPVGGTGNAYVQTAPGAICTFNIAFSDGTSLTSPPEQIGSTGVTGISFSVPTDATAGTVSATCTLGTGASTAATPVPIAPTPTPGS